MAGKEKKKERLFLIHSINRLNGLDINSKLKTQN